MTSTCGRTLPDGTRMCSEGMECRTRSWSCSMRHAIPCPAQCGRHDCPSWHREDCRVIACRNHHNADATHPGIVQPLFSQPLCPPALRQAHARPCARTDSGCTLIHAPDVDRRRCRNGLECHIAGCAWIHVAVCHEWLQGTCTSSNFCPRLHPQPPPQQQLQVPVVHRLSLQKPRLKHEAVGRSQRPSVLPKILFENELAKWQLLTKHRKPTYDPEDGYDDYCLCADCDKYGDAPPEPSAAKIFAPTSLRDMMRRYIVLCRSDVHDLESVEQAY